jgi:hypothetical protein
MLIAGGIENHVHAGSDRNWWAYLDLNQGPLRYQRSALTT